MTTLPEAWAGPYTGAAAVPGYDRAQVRPGIVHLGVGGFHRSHQAAYLDRLLAEDFDAASSWGISGVGILEIDRRMRDALTSQDVLYTIVQKDPSGDINARISGSLLEYLFLPDDPDAVAARLASPEIRIVTLTITEGGYNLEPSTKAFDRGNNTMRADADRQGPPRTHFRILADALRTRRDRGIPPFTIASCDNIQGNGHIARSTLLEFIGLTDPDFADWVATNVAFPNSMVDRITPITTDADRALARAQFGLDDQWPVPCETFTQWVLEDDFPTGRPALERVGVQFVDSVLPFEKMKLRLLNASHGVIGFLAVFRGYQYVHEAMGDPLVRSAVERFQREEAQPTLDPVPGIDLADYRATLIRRFSNPAVADTIARQCMQTSTAIPNFLLPIIREQLAADRSATVGIATVAAWACYAENNGDTIVDRRREEVVARARDTTNPYAFIESAEIFGDLGADPVFRSEFRKWRDAIRDEGISIVLTKLSQNNLLN